MTTLRRGWIHLASGAGLGRIMGFVSNLLLSRWLGPVDLGLFNLVTTTVQTSDTLVRCGADYALNFELGVDPEPMKSQRGLQLARSFSQICTLGTVFVCLGIFIWVWCFNGLFASSFIVSRRLGLTVLLLLMVLCDGCSASAWEILLVSQRTSALALRQGLFFPLRLFLASVGALYFGVIGAMSGWSLAAMIQCIWLKYVLSHLWSPLHVWPLLFKSIRALLSRGFPFYAANLLSSMIFYPLLLQVASESGLADIGYLRVGQILQQLFAFLPATLVPVLFLKMRRAPSLAGQVSVMEIPFRLIWFLLIEILLLYCVMDQFFINWLFGSGFISALLPTRLLLLTALYESLAQLMVQPLLAAGHTRLYSLWQNGSAILSAVLGWLWIPTFGLSAYLIIRLIYVIVPLIGFGNPVFQHLHQPQKMLPLILASILLLMFCVIQAFTGQLTSYTTLFSAAAFFTVLFCQRNDISLLQYNLANRD